MPLQRAHRCVALYNARERVHAVYATTSGAFICVRVSMHALLRIAGIHHAKVSTCALDIDQLSELSDRNVSRQSRFLRQVFIQWNYDSLFFLAKEEETSLMRHEPRTYME